MKRKKIAAEQVECLDTIEMDWLSPFAKLRKTWVSGENGNQVERLESIGLKWPEK